MRFGAAQIDEARKLVYVQEILDTTRFVGVWHGQTYECRAIPSTTDLTAGESVICHVMPGNSELIAVRPTAEGEILFVSAGGADYYTPEVWMFTDPTVAPIKIFQQADAGESRLVTAMAWCQATNSLIFVCSGTGGYPHNVWEYKIGDVVPTLRHTYDPDADYGAWASCIDMAEHGGKLYLWHAGTVDEGILYRCDPTNIAATFEMVFTAVAAYHLEAGEGGIAIVGGALYVIANDRIYSSPSGDSGSWIQTHDLWALNTEHSACALVTDPVNDCAYFATLKRPTYLDMYRCIRRINADGTLTLEHEEAVDWGGYPFTAITFPYAPSVDTQPAALQWYAYAKGDPKFKEHDVYRRQPAGNWTYEDSGWLDPEYVEPCAGGYDDICGSVFTIIGANQGAVYWLGRIYAIIEANWLEADMTTWHYRCLLMRQTAIGNWEMMYEFPEQHDLWASTNYHFLSCLTVGRTTKLIQNL